MSEKLKNIEYKYPEYKPKLPSDFYAKQPIVRSIKQYTGNKSTSINDALQRKNKAGSHTGRPQSRDQTLGALHMAKHLLRHIRQNPAHTDMVVYHGTGPEGVKFENGEHTTSRFLSTTKNPYTASGFAAKNASKKDRELHIVRIKVPKGSKSATDVSSLSHSELESEVLIKPKTKLRLLRPEPVTVKRKTGGKYKVWHAEIAESKTKKLKFK